MKLFHEAKATKIAGGLELWCTCIACLLASGGAHDELTFKVSRELHSHGELVLGGTSAQLCFHSFLRRADSAVQCRPPRDRQNRHGGGVMADPRADAVQ